MAFRARGSGIFWEISYWKLRIYKVQRFCIGQIIKTFSRWTLCWCSRKKKSLESLAGIHSSYLEWQISVQALISLWSPSHTAGASQGPFNNDDLLRKIFVLCYSGAWIGPKSSFSGSVDLNLQGLACRNYSVLAHGRDQAPEA